MATEKYCANCGEVKQASEFSKNKSSKDGLQAYCKSCFRKYNDGRYAASAAAYRENSREKRSAYNAGWRSRNRDRCAAASDRWRKAHPEKDAASRKLTRGRRRARIKQVPSIRFTAEDLAQRWAYYGDKCWICCAPAVETDHVKPVSKGGANMLCNLRPICVTCNRRKQGTWPFSPEMLKTN